MENDMARQKRKKRASVGILFWIAFVLFVAVVFLYNKQNIENVLETTGLVEVISDRIGMSDEERPEVTRDGEPEGGQSERPGDADGGTGDAGGGEESDAGAGGGDAGTPQRGPAEPEVELEPVEPEQTERTEDPDSPEAGGLAAEEQKPPEEPEVQPRRRTSTVYFIRVTDDGTIYPEQVERIVSYVDSPMTQTLNKLLEGPTAEELNLGLLNLIPENTRLISAAVEDGVAYLNFNESFRFNPMGVEGFVAQLQQIIYSTTEFSTVDEVQILIEGQRVDYLGGEGIYIGEPISRSTFG
jgi:spore germination protein GerM